MWSDNETAVDLVGFRVHADLVRELILDPKVLPVTIGIYGDWGGGKSSIMKMLAEDLKEKEKDGVAVLYFNGWLFEGYDDAKAALLTSILTSLRDHQRFGPSLRDRACSLLKRVDAMRVMRVLCVGAAAAGIGAVTGGVGAAGVLAAAGSGLWAAGKAEAEGAAARVAEGGDDPEAEKTLNDIRGFRDDFEKMIADSDIKTLVILIDDLDRCSPERIIDNLEAIKLFLNVPRTAFVIGADRRIIRQAVAWRYRDTLKAASIKDGGGDANDRLVEDYLEKLIQIPYRLPRLSPTEIETYLTLLFCQRHLDAKTHSAICAASDALRSEDRYSAFGHAHVLDHLKDKGCPPELAEALRIGTGIAAQITDVLQGNPRQVKRFLNAFFLRRKLADVAKLDEVQDDVLVKLMLLEYAEPRLYEKLFNGMDGETGFVTFLRELEPRAEGAKTESSTVPEAVKAEWAPAGRWLSMEPLLAEVDLRDYMWVTRDRLGSTMSGTTMIPPVVRSVFRQILGAIGKKQWRDAIKDLKRQERFLLAQQLITHAQRTPGEMNAFQALTEIAQLEPAVAEDFNNLVRRIPREELSPALATHVQLLAKQPGPLREVCRSIVRDCGDNKTRFGKALKQREV